MTIDALDLRSEPNMSSSVIGSLEAGARLFAIGQPVTIDGHVWYRAAVVAGPYSGCESDFCPPDIGYVAEGAGTEDAYLAAASVDCPESPMTAATLAGLHPLERLSCYGGDSIVVTGTIDLCYCDGPLGPVTYTPGWLASPIGQFLFHGTPGLWLRFEDGAAALEGLAPGDIVEATVAMEHEAAPDCSASGPAGADFPTRADVVLGCRTQLVVESLTVTGHDPEVGDLPVGG